MLYESNKLNYLSNKYLPLVVGSFLFGSAVYPLVAQEQPFSDYFQISLIALLFSIGAFYVFYRQRPKWKIVALNRMRIVVGTGKAEKEYSWLEVDSISLSRLMSIYTLHMKNGDEILFTAYGRTNLFTGDTSEMGDIINKMKRDLNL